MQGLNDFNDVTFESAWKDRESKTFSFGRRTETDDRMPASVKYETVCRGSCIKLSAMPSSWPIWSMWRRIQEATWNRLIQINGSSTGAFKIAKQQSQVWRYETFSTSTILGALYCTCCRFGLLIDGSGGGGGGASVVMVQDPCLENGVLLDYNAMSLRLCRLPFVAPAKDVRILSLNTTFVTGRTWSLQCGLPSADTLNLFGFSSCNGIGTSTT